MDRKSVIVVLVSIVVLFSWLAIINRIYPPIPIPAGQTNQFAAPSNTFAPKPDTPAATSTHPTAVASTRSVAAVPAGPEQTVTLENDAARFTFTSHGGGIKQVELKRYPATVNCRNKNISETNRLAALNTHVSTAALALAGATEIEGDGFFDLSKTRGGVRAEKVLPSGLRITKEFQLATNYILNATIRVENPTEQSVVIPAHRVVVGTATPIGQHDESMYLGFEWYDGEKKPTPINAAWFANRPLGCLPGQPRTEYLAGA